jgi:hypothetical protein
MAEETVIFVPLRLGVIIKEDANFGEIGTDYLAKSVPVSGRNHR